MEIEQNKSELSAADVIRLLGEKLEIVSRKEKLKTERTIWFRHEGFWHLLVNINNGKKTIAEKETSNPSLEKAFSEMQQWLEARG